MGAPAITLLGAEDDPNLHGECVRIARRLHAAGKKVIGFIPATPRVAVPPAALQIASALVELTGATVAFVDANVRYPALASTTSDGEGAEALREAMRAGEGDFRTRWVRGSLAVLSPPHAERAGDAVPALERLLVEGIELFEYVLVDLTGFDLLGEHASAAARMDGVILVGRAHQTRERDILRVRGELPTDRLFGVLLVG